MQEQKVALIGLLRQASEIITHEAMATDINTAAEALHQASDEKFASMVNLDSLAKLASTLPKDQTPDGEGVKQGTEQTAPEASGAKVETNQLPDVAESLDSDMVKKSDGPVITMKSAAEAAGAWNSKAAAAVLAKLAADAGRPDAVPAAALPKEQIPDGKSEGEGTVTDTPDNTGAKLPKEQTPEDATVIKSDMVAKSDGPVDTMESKAAAEAPAPAPEKEEGKEEPKEAAEEGYVFAGIQMGGSSSVEPVQLEASDSELHGLFNN